MKLRLSKIAHPLSVLFLCLGLLGCQTANPSFEEDDIAIIPRPASLELSAGSFRFAPDTRLVVTDDQQRKAATFLSELFAESAGFTLTTADRDGGGAVVFRSVDSLAEGAYRLTVHPDSIAIAAGDESGFFYAVQTLRQLLPAAIESPERVAAEWVVPAVAIRDAPRFPWRGMHMDFSRHFFNVDEVKAFLDHMALYKMNTYHMHLTDDQGWRMEIKQYPLLTSRGGWRLPNDQDSLCMERAEDNALYTIDESNFREVNGERQYGGYFTQEELKEIVAYADDRCITIIPEIDMPGHFKSAIDNYPFLSCTEESGWDKVFTYPACLGKETTYEFMKNILAEVAEIFPAEYIHIGGDEVNINSWEECPHCQRAIRENGLADEHELQSHFNREIEQFLQARGKKLMGWDEIVTGGLTEDASVMWWRNWYPDAPVTAAANGNDVVVTTTAAYYFDYLNEGTTLKGVYEYEPVPEGFTPEQEKHILGIQANLWSERIPNFSRLQYQAFPRLLAVAENGWAPGTDKDFTAFNQRVEEHYDRLERLDVYYYIPAVVGLDKEIAIVDRTAVALDLAYPLEGTDIYYTLDGTTPTRDSRKYTEPFTVNDTVEIRARAYRGDLFNDLKKTRVVFTDYVAAAEVTPEASGLQRHLLRGKYAEVEDLPRDPATDGERVDSIDIGAFRGEEPVNMLYRGYFHAPEDAVYEFETRSDGGDHLFIGDQLVVDNGGWHGPRKRYGKVALKQGWHPLLIKYRPSDNPRVISAWYGKQGETLRPLTAEVTGF